MTRSKPCPTCGGEMLFGKLDGKDKYACRTCWHSEQVNGATVCVEPRPAYDAKLPGLKRLARPKHVALEMVGESRLEDDLYHQMRMAGLPLPQTQYQFADRRRWRFDFAWPDLLLAVEVEGGVWTRGRHQRPIGFLKDCEKYNFAAIRGWTVLRVAAPHISNGKALMWIQAAFDNNERPKQQG